jgi:protocatechuate 3,4-dioxygenase beta subunit
MSGRMSWLWTTLQLLRPGALRSPTRGLDRRRLGFIAPQRRWGTALLVGVGMLGLVGCDPAPRDQGTSASTSTSTSASITTAAGAGVAGAEQECAPTRGEAAQGTGEAAADAPSTARLGPGMEVPRTAATVAKGRSGQRLVVSGTVYRADCVTPLAGASIVVWQTNAEGEYGPGQGTGNSPCCYLAAALRTDRRGRYRLETVKPGHYKGEADPPPAHIHFEVRHPEADGVLTELLFEGDPRLGPYPPGVVVRPATVPGSDPPALHARFDIVLDS